MPLKIVNPASYPCSTRLYCTVCIYGDHWSVTDTSGHFQTQLQYRNSNFTVKTLPPAMWTCRMYSPYSSSSVDMQDVSLNSFFEMPECLTVRHPVSTVTEYKNRQCCKPVPDWDARCYRMAMPVGINLDADAHLCCSIVGAHPWVLRDVYLCTAYML